MMRQSLVFGFCLPSGHALPTQCAVETNQETVGDLLESECANLEQFDCCTRCFDQKTHCVAVDLSNGCCNYYRTKTGTRQADGSQHLFNPDSPPVPPPPTTTTVAPSPAPKTTTVAPSPAPKTTTVAPSPAPTTTPAPSPPPSPGSVVASFAAIGDWGYSSSCNGGVSPACQGLIGDALKDFKAEQGDKFKFVVNVGDSFYCDGVGDAGDERWNTMWRSHYGDSNSARDATQVPWYSVYGNHDMGGRDQCACVDSTSECNQVNNGVTNWIMPDVNYYVTRSDLNVEIIGIDANVDWAGEVCKYSSCDSGSCTRRLMQRMKEGEQLLSDRYAQSSAKTLIVFSHYPTDYLGAQPGMLGTLSDSSKHDIVYFGGHRHNTDQFSPNIGSNQQWLVGGGGGYGCDGGRQGFVKGFIHSDGSVTTEGAFVDSHQCCGYGSHGPKEAPAPGAGSVEAVICMGTNCTSHIIEQGRCLPVQGGGHARLWCEASAYVKIDWVDEHCKHPNAWDLVPQQTAFATKHAPESATVEFRCDRAGTVPEVWIPPRTMVVPSPSAQILSTNLGQMDAFNIHV